jgi:RNA polymerase sigma factor (sigma-70 family)
MEDMDLEDDDLALESNEPDADEDLELDSQDCDLESDSEHEGNSSYELSEADDAHVNRMLGLDPDDEELEEIHRKKELKREMGGIETFMGKTMFTHRVLNREEEVMAWKLIQDGDKRGMEILVRFNQKLVRKVAQQYIKSGMAIEDLVIEGNLGLIRAAELFEADRGFRFSTYAMSWIRQAITRAIANQNSIVRVPVHVHKLRVKIIRAVNQIRDKEIVATPDRVHDFIKKEEPEFNASLDNVARIMRDFMYLNSSSLNQAIDKDGEGSDLMGMVSSDADSLDESDLSNEYAREELKVQIIRALTQKEFDVICYRFGIFGRPALTLEDVGKYFSLTRERIRQIEVKALRRLRFKLRSVGIDEKNFHDFISAEKSSSKRIKMG